MTTEVEDFRMILLSNIKPDENQPRKNFDDKDLKKLADSISQYGLIQPIMVRPIDHPSYDYEIVYGERRFRAHKLLGLEKIKALIWKNRESHVQDLQLIENIQRKKLSDIELAWEFKRRQDTGQTHQQIADVIGKNRTYVTQRLNLLKLSKQDQQKIKNGEMKFSQARSLSSVENPEARHRISEKINSDLTQNETLNIIREETPKIEPNVTRVTSPDKVQTSELQIWATLHDEKGCVKEKVPRSTLIGALLDDLKQLGAW